MARPIACPSCGGTNDVHNPGITLVVCAYCSTALYWDEQAVLQAGEKSILVQGDTRLFDGASGTLRGQRFRVVGHVRYDWGGGTWDEWYVDLEGAGAAWLSEDERELSLERPLDPAGAPPSDTLRIGAEVRLAGRAYTVRETRSARCVGGWGQLPFMVLPNESYPYADLASTDGQHFATLEYDRRGTVRVFTGEPIAHDALKVEGAPPEDTAAATSGTAVACAGCGASLQRPTGFDVQTLVCDYCGTQNELQGAAAKAMGKNPKGFDPRFMLAIGQRGNFEGATFEVIGRLLSADDEGYEARQYLLWNAERDFLYLEEEAGKFILTRSTLQAPNADPFDLDEGDRVRVGTETYRFVEDGTSTVRYVDGALPWTARTGDTSRYADFTGTGGAVYGAERTAQEIEYSVGTSLPRAAVNAAFGLQGVAKAGAHTNLGAVQRKSGMRSCLVVAAGAGVVMLLLIALGVVAASFGMREDAAATHASYLDAEKRAHTLDAQLQKVTKSEPWLAACAPESKQWPARVQSARQSLAELDDTALAELKQQIDRDEFWGFTELIDPLDALKKRRDAALAETSAVAAELDRWLGFKRDLPSKAERYRDHHRAVVSAELARPRRLVREAEKDWPGTDHNEVRGVLAAAEASERDAEQLWKAHLPAHQTSLEGTITPAVCKELPEAWTAMEQHAANLLAAVSRVPTLINELYTGWEKQLVDMEIIEGEEVSFRHQYRTITVSIPRSQAKPTKPRVDEAWQPVTRDTYDTMERFLGMAVAHKAPGHYEGQTAEMITPPGYSFLVPEAVLIARTGAAPPASERNVLGRWQHPGRDDSAWVWLPTHATLGPLLWGTHYAPTYGDIQAFRAELARQRTYLGERGGRPLFGNLGAFTTLFLANNTYYRNDMFRNTRYITSGRTYLGRRYVESYRGGSSSGSRYGGGK